LNHIGSNNLLIYTIFDVSLLLKSPHRTLNSSRGIIRYRDDDLDELTDDEICKELAHQGVTHGKRFVSKRNGQEIKLNTFLPKFCSPTILRSIRMGL
jgi:hypothetical protein